MVFLRDARLWIVAATLAIIAAGAACVPDIDTLPDGPVDSGDAGDSGATTE